MVGLKFSKELPKIAYMNFFKLKLELNRLLPKPSKIISQVMLFDIGIVQNNNVGEL